MEIKFVLQRYGELTPDERCRFKSGVINSKAVRVGPYFPDYAIFNKQDRPVEVGLFAGCEYHGHLTPEGSCSILPKYANEETLNFHRERYGSLSSKLNLQISHFKSQGMRVNYVWECEWIKKHGPLGKDEKVPLKRLIPRDGLRYIMIIKKLFDIY